MNKPELFLLVFVLFYRKSIVIVGLPQAQKRRPENAIKKGGVIFMF